MKKPSDSALALVLVCARDADLLEPFAALFSRAFPKVEIVWAVDRHDPFFPADGRRQFGFDWTSPWMGREVADAMLLAVAETGAEWVIKTDLDAAHLTPDWLDDARADSVLIGLQNGRGADMMGLAFAVRRRTLLEAHASGRCHAVGNEAGLIHRAVRRRWPNHIWLWPHRPAAGGLFAALRGPERAAQGRRYSVLHCGVGPRSGVAAAMQAVRKEAAKWWLPG